LAVTAARAWFLILLGLLGACTGDYETFEPPPLDFSARQPFDLAVERVVIDSVYRPTGEPPYVDHLMQLSPESATRALLTQRLRAVGGTDRLFAVILEASVQEETLEPAAGLRGFLTTEPAARLTGRIKVRVDRLNPAGSVTRSITTAVERTRAIPEGVGYAERERIGYELVLALVDDLDVGLTANVREGFSDLLQSGSAGAGA
jgi:hypothetical protein